MKNNWVGKRVLIIGAARQGLALAGYLARQGASVTLNDKSSPEQMQEAMNSLSGLDIQWVLGSHPASLLDHTDLVCISGGVPLTLPLVVAAQQRGLPLSNDSQIFLEEVPCRVIGITGSAGKTTTTTLVGRMAQTAVCAPHTAWVGGNIGLPLISSLDQMKPDDTVVMELSSFQLELMDRSTQIGAILNITPNHLDRHGTLAAYTAAKARLLDFQSTEDIAVLNREDQGSWGLLERVKGNLVSFGARRPSTNKMQGSFYENGSICLLTNDQVNIVMPKETILLRGQHNLMNVLAACAIANAAGFSTESMVAGVTGFGGVAHRLELVCLHKGAAWYNDSIATAPERTMAAIRSFDESLVLLLGGRDKNLPWEDLAALIHQRVDHVILFGEAAEKIERAIGATSNGQRPYTLQRFPTLHPAVLAAAEIVQPGDVVLLSPGGTSFDEFHDFEERGERFRQWVKELL
jgi:UDP-N-acetylmuramoylalanine--D-glutamate ligase